MIVTRDLVIGSYQLVDEIDRGGNGEVWQAISQRNENVAIKILFEFNDPKKSLRRAARFRKEIAILKELNELEIEGVMPLLDSGELADGRPWYAMPLAHKLDHPESDVSRITWAIKCGIDVCQIVEKMLKMAGTTHRDIKPSNILMLEGVLTLADFGLVIRDSDEDDLTASGEMPGSVGYHAPEAVQTDHTPNPAGDVFSIGKTLWALIARRRPEEGCLSEEHFDDPVFADAPDGLKEMLILCTSREALSRPEVGHLREALIAVVGDSDDHESSKTIDITRIAKRHFGSTASATKLSKSREKAASELRLAAGSSFKEKWQELVDELGWPNFSGGGGTVLALSKDWAERGFEPSGRFYQELDLDGQKITVSLLFWSGINHKPSQIRMGISLAIDRRDSGSTVEIDTHITDTYYQGVGYEAAQHQVKSFAGDETLFAKLLNQLKDLSTEPPEA